VSSYLAEAHADWHSVNGRYNVNCPLDCGAGEPIDEWWCQVEGCEGSSVTYPSAEGPQTSATACTASAEAHAAWQAQVDAEVAAWEAQRAAEDAAWYAANPQYAPIVQGDPWAAAAPTDPCPF
jgi:hypothetical protein